MSLPGLSSPSSGLVVSVSLAQTTGFLAGSGEATGFAVLEFDQPMPSRPFGVNAPTL